MLKMEHARKQVVWWRSFGQRSSLWKRQLGRWAENSWSGARVLACSLSGQGAVLSVVFPTPEATVCRDVLISVIGWFLAPSSLTFHCINFIHL